MSSFSGSSIPAKCHAPRNSQDGGKWHSTDGKGAANNGNTQQTSTDHQQRSTTVGIGQHWSLMAQVIASAVTMLTQDRTCKQQWRTCLRENC